MVNPCQVLTHFPKKPWFLCVCILRKSFKNTVGKGEIVHNEQFLLFSQCFLPIWRTFCHFHQIWNCHLQTLLVWKSLKCGVWERFKDLSSILLLHFTAHSRLNFNDPYKPFPNNKF